MELTAGIATSRRDRLLPTVTYVGLLLLVMQTLLFFFLPDISVLFKHWTWVIAFERSCMLLPVVILFVRHRAEFVPFVQMRRPDARIMLKVAAYGIGFVWLWALIFGGLTASSLTAYFNFSHHLKYGIGNIIKAFNTPVLLLLSFLRTLLLVVLIEELFWRGLLQNVLAQRMGRIKALVLASLLFGAWHLMVIPLESAVRNTPVLYSFPYHNILLGFLFGYVYERYGNIWYPIVTHFSANWFLKIVIHGTY